MNFYIITVSKHAGDEVSELVNEYKKRLRGAYSLDIINIKPISQKIDSAELKKREAEKIFNALPKGKSYIIACDENGKQLETHKLAEKLEQVSALGNQNIVFIIGGAFGLDESVLKKSDFVLGLSKMTLAHRVALLVLAEQIYRVYSIFTNHPYSK